MSTDMSERKKRILLISCFFYPQNRIPVLRIGQWAKYWASEVHDVTVLTTKKYALMGRHGLEPSRPEEVWVVELTLLPQILKRSAMPPIRDGKKQTAGKSISTESSLKKRVRSLRGYIGSNVGIHDFWVR